MELQYQKWLIIKIQGQSNTQNSHYSDFEGISNINLNTNLNTPLNLYPTFGDLNGDGEKI